MKKSVDLKRLSRDINKLLKYTGTIYLCNSDSLWRMVREEIATNLVWYSTYAKIISYPIVHIEVYDMGSHYNNRYNGGKLVGDFKYDYSKNEKVIEIVNNTVLNEKFDYAEKMLIEKEEKERKRLIMKTRNELF